MLNLAGSSHFARRYFGNLGWFLFLQLLRCFSSPRSPCNTMYSCCNTPKGGFPHSEICGSKCVCSLPAAYRKLLRPSSPVIAKASTMCTYSLVPITLDSGVSVNCLTQVHHQKQAIVLITMSITLAFAVSQGSLYFEITSLQFRLGSLFNTFYVCLIQSQPFHKLH